MKTIKYANYKNNNSNLVTIKDSYNTEDKTIKIEDRQVFEFDTILNGNTFHLKLLNKSAENQTIENYDFDHPTYYYGNRNGKDVPNTKGFFFEEDEIKDFEFVAFYKDNKEVLDKLIIESGKTFDVEKLKKEKYRYRLRHFINTIFNDFMLDAFINSIKFKKAIEDGIIFNLKIYNPNEIMEEVPEQEKEEFKIITMKYSDFLRTGNKYKKVKDSYNKETKTIDVYVPLDYKN